MPCNLLKYLFTPSCLLASLLLVSPANAVQSKPGMPRAQRHQSRHQIEKLEQDWREAVLHRNVSAMDSLLSDDYIAITSDGRLQSKDETLSNLRNGNMHFATLEFSDRKVRFYGQTALVTSRAEVSGTLADQDISGSYRYTRVYVRDGHGGWKIVSFEISRIREGAESK